MVPIAGGRFAFRDLPPGQYVVALQTATGDELARSQPADLASGAEVEVLFGSDATPAAAALLATGGGLTTTQVIALAAGALGITTAIVIAHKVASPSR
jgi:hypothetical protein